MGTLGPKYIPFGCMDPQGYSLNEVQHGYLGRSFKASIVRVLGLRVLGVEGEGLGLRARRCSGVGASRVGFLRLGLTLRV